MRLHLWKKHILCIPYDDSVHLQCACNAYVKTDCFVSDSLYLLLFFVFCDLWKEWDGVTPIFRSFHRTASSTIGGWSRWDILNVIFLSFLVLLIFGP